MRYEVQVLFIMWHSSKSSFGKAMCPLLTLNLLTWDLTYFFLTWEKFKAEIRVDVSLATMNLNSLRS